MWYYGNLLKKNNPFFMVFSLNLVANSFMGAAGVALMGLPSLSLISRQPKSPMSLPLWKFLCLSRRYCMPSARMGSIF